MEIKHLPKGLLIGLILFLVAISIVGVYAVYQNKMDVVVSREIVSPKTTAMPLVNVSPIPTLKLFSNSVLGSEKPDFLMESFGEESKYLCFAENLSSRNYDAFVQKVESGLRGLNKEGVFDLNTMEVSAQKYFYQISLKYAGKKSFNILNQFYLMNCHDFQVYLPIKVGSQDILVGKWFSSMSPLNNEDFLQFAAFLKQYDILELGNYGMTSFEDLLSTDLNVTPSGKHLREVFQFGNNCDYEDCKEMKFKRIFDLRYDEKSGEFRGSFI